MGDEKREIAAFYARGLERDRLSAGQGALELLRTQQLLERYLPPPPAVLADIGGGPGRYALWLAGRGYRVHLVDPLPLHIEQARTALRSSSEAHWPACRWETPDGFRSRTRVWMRCSCSVRSIIYPIEPTGSGP